MRSLSMSLSATACSALVALACLFSPNAQAQDVQAQTPAREITHTITLDPPTGWELQVHSFDAQGNARPAAPANFRHLGEAKVGEQADLHSLTLRFAETTRITGISVTGDFRIEQGGSCDSGNTYQKGTTCTVLARFTPTGAGNRLGKLTVSNELSATPDAFGLGGYGYSPIISFIPSVITTIPASYPSSVGLLNGAQNLAIDGGDTLWVSDTGNNVVRNMDSSGTFKTLASGFSAPWGITVDTFGEAYFTRPAANAIHEIYDYGPIVTLNGAGTGACTASTPCTLSSHTVTNPGELSMDAYNHMFFTEQTEGGAFSTVQPLAPNLIFLYDPFPYQTNPQGPAAMDSGDNIYSFWTTSGNCELTQQSLYDAENSYVAFNKIAGGHTCGFAGDGGLAGNAEIGTSVGQIAFDTAGNLYFTDTANQRVRRIDYVTGTIRTIAGNGRVGYALDGYPATIALLNNPTGVGVDSQGQVYIISGTGTGSEQVVRKVTSEGEIYFGSQARGTKSAAQTIEVSNTGNAAMVLSSWVINGTNPSDFAIDPNTTSCLLTAGSVLQSGASCQIGVTFTPAAGGGRFANLVLLDNTVNNSNIITFSGAGVLPAATFKITSPVGGDSYSGTVVFTATVTSSSGPAPTGTVTFKVDSTTYSPVTLSSGTATMNVTSLSAGGHTFTATYSGDANYAAAGPINVSASESAAQPALTPQVSLTRVGVPEFANRAEACNTMNFEVLVSNNTTAVPTGDVQLFQGSKQLTAGTLSDGRVVLSAPPMGPGKYSLTAHYNGDVLDLPAVSPALTQVVSESLVCMPVLPRLDAPHAPVVSRLAF